MQRQSHADGLTRIPKGQREDADAMMDVLPLADELVAGQIGRWRLLNRFGSDKQFAAELRRRYAAKGIGPRDAPLIHVVAGLCGMRAHEYARLHTMLPFTAFTCLDPQRMQGWGPATARLCGKSIPRRAAYLCPNCVAEDRAFWGYSYWRRSHQLPGAFWCQKHIDAPLRAVTESSAFAVPPQTWLDSGKTLAHRFPRSMRDQAGVSTFVQVCQAMLDDGRIHLARGIRLAISARAKEFDLRARKNGNGETLLSDLARQMFPKAFLVAIFPVLSKKKPAEFFQSIDGIVLENGESCVPSATALASAILFPSISDAFQAFGEAEALAAGHTSLQSRSKIAAAKKIPGSMPYA